jgi:predicted nucleotidyltransferase
LTKDERAEREQLLHRVRQAAAALKARFDVHRVVLFGSLAHEAWFVPDSDVDLAVEGLPSKDYWRAWRLVEDMIIERPVDLIDMETATASLRRAIERYGVEL